MWTLDGIQPSTLELSGRKGWEIASLTYCSKPQTISSRLGLKTDGWTIICWWYSMSRMKWNMVVRTAQCYHPASVLLVWLQHFDGLLLFITIIFFLIKSDTYICTLSLKTYWPYVFLLHKKVQSRFNHLGG